MAPFLYLKIGNTTLADGTGVVSAFSIDGQSWVPKIANRVYDSLGDTIYSDVEEVMTVNITAATSQELRLAVAKFVNVFEQAQRWAMGDDTIAPTLIQYVPIGSTVPIVTPYEAIVLGATADDLNAFQYGETYFDSARTLYLHSAPLRFKRRGAWLQATKTPVSTTSVPVGEIFTITFADNELTLSPTNITWTLPTVVNSTAYTTSPVTLFLTSDRPQDLGIINIRDLMANPAAPYNTTYGTSSNARSGQFVRPSNYAVGAWQTLDGNILNYEPGTYIGYLNVLTDAIGAAAQFAFVFNDGSRIYSDMTPIPNTGGIAWPVCLGTATIRDDRAIKSIEIVGINRTTGITRIEMDYMVLAKVHEQLNIITIDSAIVNAATMNPAGINSGTMRVDYKHQSTTNRTPKLLYECLAGNKTITPGISGRFLLATQNDVVEGCVMGSNTNTPTFPAGYNGPFRYVNNAGALQTLIVTTTRKPFVLVPQ